MSDSEILNTPENSVLVPQNETKGEKKAMKFVIGIVMILAILVIIGVIYLLGYLKKNAQDTSDDATIKLPESQYIQQEEPIINNIDTTPGVTDPSTMPVYEQPIP